MILTCPACDTKYVVKDGAIPAGGRQVRCASCKHSWHQDPEIASKDVEGNSADESTASSMLAVDAMEQPGGEMPGESRSDTAIVGAQEPILGDHPNAEGTAIGEGRTVEAPAFDTGYDGAPQSAADQQSSVEEASGWQPSSAVQDEEEFVGYAPIAGETERPKRRWPILLALILVIAAAAAAFWFLAPAEWKARAGIAEASATPLQLMITTRERQPMQSGQELVLLGGRIINPTDKTQRVPPIQVQLRDPQSRMVLHRWTITPPRNQLGPGESTTFNSAEVDKQRDGEQLVDIALRSNGATY